MPGSADVSIVIQAINQASSVINSVKKDLQSFSDQAKNSLSNASSSIKGSMDVVKNSVDRAVSYIGPALVGAVAVGGAALLSLGGYGLKTAADIEQTRISFDVLSGSVENGRKLMGDLVTMAAKTPFESRDLQKNAQLLLNYGVKLENILPSLSMLGDISAGNAEKLSGLTLAMSQIASTGRLTGQDLLQMINNGFNPLQIISEKTGKSMADLKKQMENGQISYQMIEEAMKDATSEGGRFYKMMDKQSNSALGLVSTLKDNLSIALNQIIGITKDGEIIPGSMFESAKNSIKDLGFWLDNNKVSLVALGSTVGTVVVGAFSLLGSIISGIVTIFTDYQGVVYMVGGALTAILIPSLIGLGTTLMTVTIPAIIATATAFAPLLIVGALVGALIYGIKLARDTNFLGIRDAVTSFVSVTVELFQALRQSITTIFNSYMQITRDIFTGFVQLFSGDREGLSQTLQDIWNNLWIMIGEVFGINYTQLQLIRDESMLYLSTSWSNTWTSVKNFFSSIWSQIKTVYTVAVQSIGEFFAGGGRTMIETGFTAMLGGLVGLMKGIINGVTAGFEAMVNSGINSVNALIDAINRAGSAVGLKVNVPRMPLISLPRFAFGGIVEGANGIDKVPALLSPGELILNKAQQQNLAGQLQGSSGQTVYITFAPQIYGSKESLAEEIMDDFMKQFRQNTRFESY